MLKNILLCIMILLAPSAYAQELTKKEQAIIRIVSQHAEFCFLKNDTRIRLSYLKKGGMSKQDALEKFANNDEMKIMVYEVYGDSELSDDIDYFNKCIEDKNAKLQPTSSEAVASWAIQIAAIPNKERAEKFQDKLKQNNYNTYIVVDGNTYRVFVGPYIVKEDAIRIQQEIKQKFHELGIIRPYVPNKNN